MHSTKHLLVLAVFATLSAFGQPSFQVSLKHESAPERRTKAQLERLLGDYDLSPWVFTKTICIDDHAIPHSHPVLTLHTRHLKDDDLFLSTFMHEQIHWFLAQRKTATDHAIDELRALFPALPLGYPQGSSDAYGNHLHLLVIALEYRACRQLLGELRARTVMEFWSTDHYTRLYRIVLEQETLIQSLLKKHHLLPEQPPQPN